LKKYLYIHTLLLLFVFCFTCHGQDKTDKANDATGQSESNLIETVGSKTTIAPYAPMTITRKIKLDKEGNLLIASYEGIIRYDGVSFTNWTKEKGLDTCYAFDVLEDKKGNIWIGSDKFGAYSYDGNSFTHITTREGLAHDRLIALHEDSKGNIWFATQGGLSRYDGKSFLNFTTREGLPHNDVSCILEDRTGKLWIGTRGDACTYDGKSFTKIINKDGQSFEGITSIIEDKKGNIWLGGKDGLWWYNGSSFTKFSKEGSGVYEDSKGNIWTTTDAWINKARPNPHKWVLSRYDETNLLDQKPTAIQIHIGDGMFFGVSEDKEGNIWVGTLDGVFRYDGRSITYFKDTGGEE